MAGGSFAVVLLVVTVSLQAQSYSRPTAKSASCMSCHDGSSGIEIREHVSHKVELDYDAVQRFSSAGLRRSSEPSAFGGTVAETLLVEGRVECASCHYTHEEPTETSFRLRMVNGSYVPLCTSCHDMNRL